MATDVETLQARLDAIEKAYANGVLVVRHGDESLTYRSLDEMAKIIGTLQNQIARSTKKRRVNYFAQTGKGL